MTGIDRGSLQGNVPDRGNSPGKGVETQEREEHEVTSGRGGCLEGRGGCRPWGGMVGDEARIKENNGGGLLDVMSSDGRTVKGSEQDTDSLSCVSSEAAGAVSQLSHDPDRRLGG